MKDYLKEFLNKSPQESLDESWKEFSSGLFGRISERRFSRISAEIYRSITRDSSEKLHDEFTWIFFVLRQFLRNNAKELFQMCSKNSKMWR